jgi:hypothetical protein
MKQIKGRRLELALWLELELNLLAAALKHQILLSADTRHAWVGEGCSYCNP